jgi:serine/threonine protein kinase
MEPTSVESLCNLLVKSRLLPGDDIRALRQRWLAEANDNSTDVSKFGEWLVANHYVTHYQATMLLRGYGDRFFLNQYKLLGRIGQGRMAGVYKAVHNLGQTVAVKVLPPSKAKDARLLGRFQREARLALLFKHPNVVRTFQADKADELNYLVMEYLDGETLQEVLERRGKLPPAEAVRLIHQALLGLQHLHEKNVVHRDLKPGNLMLVPGHVEGQPDNTLQATVKLLDVGLGRALNEEDSDDTKDNVELTAQGVILGTPDYMAPEQARDAHSADIRADIYSLGCTLYHAIAGQPPFRDSNLVRQMVRHATEKPKPLKEFNPEVPDGLQQIVDWLLAKDPAQRYPTPGRAAQALQVFLVAGSEPPRTPEGDPKMRPYLNWLEANGGGVAVSAPAVRPAGVVPTAPPAPARPAGVAPAVPQTAPSLSPVVAPPTRPSGLAKPVTPVPAAPVPTAPAKVDVELVPAPPPSQRMEAITNAMQLSRRDCIMLALGAGGVLLAEAIGLLLSRALVSRKKDDEPGGQEDK